jgi:16S rRNA (guanine1207-N2)-methyltransferase
VHDGKGIGRPRPLMATSRLSLGLENGTAILPESGRIAVFRARGEDDLSGLPIERAHIIQGFFPDNQAIAQQGYDVGVVPSGIYSAAVVFLPRSKAEARDLIAQAANCTDGGPVIVDGQKTDGVDSLLKDCRKNGAEIGAVYAKAHGKMFSVSGGTFTDWRQPDALQVAGGYFTAPGVFSADAVDRGSQALAAALPSTLRGRVADLGAGWGYLAFEVLKNAAVTECHLIEAEHSALECARKNISDPRASFHWSDATTFTDAAGFDHVVCNPPFHVSRAGDPSIGRAFIAASARILSTRGTLWLVANRHLPYEAALAEAFSVVAEVSGNPSFKVFRAEKPIRTKR